MRVLLSALAVAASAVATSHAHASPFLFEEQTAKLGTPQPCFNPANPNDEGCYSHYAVMADLNGDRALDIVFANGGGYFVPSAAAPIAVYINGGAGTFHESAGPILGGFHGRVAQVAVGDVDGDGDLDIYVPDAYGLQADAFFINDGRQQPSFANEAAQRLPLSSRAGAVRFGDVDGDGDLDLVVADWGERPPATPGTARIYLNDGKGYFTERAGAVIRNTDSMSRGPVDLDLFDADGDFDLDLLIANRLGDALLFVNDGTGTFSNDPMLPPHSGPYVYGPDECDVDGDGDLDLWLDNGGKNDTEQLLINDGTGHFTDETSARVTGNPFFVDDNVIRCADVNGDGALDAVIGSLSDNRRVLLNDGKGRFALSPNGFPVQALSTLGLDVGDVDGDGRIDVVTAQGERGPFLNRLYLGTDAVPADTRPPVVRSLERLADGTPPGSAVVRFAIYDNATTDVGPRLRSATIEVADEVVPAVFVGGDLFRAVLRVPPARVTYRACAVDWAGNRGCGGRITFLPKGADVDGSSGQAYRVRGGCALPGSTSCSASALALFASAALLARFLAQPSRTPTLRKATRVQPRVAGDTASKGPKTCRRS